MRIPQSLEVLLDEGILQEVLRPLRSGKEAQVYLVQADDLQCVAKVYKDVERRSFQNRGSYTEGRKSKNSRDARAIGKSSRHGRAKGEEAWRSVEVDTIYRLQAAGVRVPKPYHFIEGVLVMELICDAEGQPAKRLGELSFDAEEAQRIFAGLLREVVRMLCSGTVHGDLSDFNILMAADGPIVIDFPQAVNAAKNQHARALLLRDVANLQNFVATHVADYETKPYAEEIWALYEAGELRPDFVPQGKFETSSGPANTGMVMSLIEDANEDERFRRSIMGKSLTGMPAATRPSTLPPSQRPAARGSRPKKKK